MYLRIFSFLSLPLFCWAVQCYSGSQLQVIECPALSCIKQTLGFDTVRYCDGTGVSSICQTYRIFETCESIPNLGFICCCSGNLCNSSITSPYIVTLIASFLFLFYRFN
ncbi:hypothetical protein V3C99_014996 [Haemonchus contortus]|uniref:UPAR/Ly6 domain-containing protein n=1 Tax=Haemonchus contortus TaxID=6289 RepID=A0A7I4YTZ3_HAECO